MERKVETKVKTILNLFQPWSTRVKPSNDRSENTSPLLLMHQVINVIHAIIGLSS